MATEKRLIDANALLEKIQYRLPIVGTIGEVLSDIVGMTRRHIEEAPTVDAVEVVHGRWEDIYNGRYANPRFCCSVCKTKALYVAVQTALGNWRDEQDLSNYCHNCGADMRGGEDA